MCFRKYWHTEICHTKNVIASYTKTQCTDAAKCYTRTVTHTHHTHAHCTGTHTHTHTHTHTIALYHTKANAVLNLPHGSLSLTIIGLRSRRSLDTTLVLYAKLYSVAVESKTWRASRLRHYNSCPSLNMHS